MARFRPFPEVSTRYGAPMGRASRALPIEPDTTPDALCVAGPAYEYDAGGAYWGLPYGGSGPVWAVWVRGRGRDGVAYVRARSRDAAKRAVLEDTAQ